MQPQQPPQPPHHPMPGPVPPHLSLANITTEQIQKYLDENKQLILAILDNQNLGKLSESGVPVCTIDNFGGCLMLDFSAICATPPLEMEKSLSSTLGCGAATPFEESKASRVPNLPRLQRVPSLLQVKNPLPFIEMGRGRMDQRWGTFGWVWTGGRCLWLDVS
ncbi:hypothetical protein Taro_028590 [Colocasia esculenta]|uniref:SS18 N-terminal domain-containing protein n=1 Tax=Colocasia esculenta TaxID=4460 RepID=A0A843VUL8_COLES|nr:hypothetical protein [Colocasia esculenta]